MVLNGEAKPRGRARPKPPKQTKEEMLFEFRTLLECGHREMIYRYATNLIYKPSFRDVDCLPAMDSDEFLDTCNKSVPVYVLKGCQYGTVICTVLHNYIYRRWFRPFRSEIEHYRFLCKFMTPLHLPDGPTSLSQSNIDGIVSINGAVCAEVEARHRDYDQQLASAGQDEATWPLIRREVKNHNRFNVLQPLFRALLVIVSADNYHNEDSTTAGRIPVLLVRTGVEDGLSAPVTFEAIVGKPDSHVDESSNIARTTLETAIDFVMDLEAREAVAFGLQPDPVISWDPIFYSFDNWEKRWGIPLAGPSSRFVDTDKHPVWSGLGQHLDSNAMVIHEQRNLRFEARRLRGELY